MKIISATLGGIIGAAQLSTACCIAFPKATANVLLTGAAGPYLLWSVPLGALAGVVLGWLLAHSPNHSNFLSECRKALPIAIILGLLVAPMAPGFLGLGPQSVAELWNGLAVLTGVGWAIVTVLAQCERFFLGSTTTIK